MQKYTHKVHQHYETINLKKRKMIMGNFHVLKKK